MNSKIPLKFRSLTALLYFIGMIPLGSIVILSFSDNYNNNRLTNYDSIISTLITYAIIFGFQISFYALVVSGLLWLFTKAKHPFVDRSGRYAFHYLLNSFIARVFYVFVLASTCGVVEESINHVLLNTCLIIISCIEIAYFLNSLVASMFALKGRHFNNSFITPFIKPE
jgi:uncharacterized Tic20 family protein